MDTSDDNKLSLTISVKDVDKVIVEVNREYNMSLKLNTIQKMSIIRTVIALIAAGNATGSVEDTIKAQICRVYASEIQQSNAIIIPRNFACVGICDYDKG